MKQIQIPETLFIDLIKYHLMGIEIDEKPIKKALQAKLDAMQRRDIYSTYKSGKTEDEREAARKKYLDEKGIPEEYRF